MNTEKKIHGIDIGDRVEVRYDGYNSKPITGKVTRNDADCCIVRRDDVPEVKEYKAIDGGRFTQAKVLEQNVYIFGDIDKDGLGRTYGVSVRKIA